MDFEVDAGHEFLSGSQGNLPESLFQGNGTTHGGLDRHSRGLLEGTRDLKKFCQSDLVSPVGISPSLRESPGASESREIKERSFKGSIRELENSTAREQFYSN